MAEPRLILTRLAAATPAASSKSDQAYAWLRDRITTQELQPGYRLVLGTVAAELGMSVVPVREAIRQLESEGLVSFERNVGARVAMIDDGQYRHSMECLAVLEGTATALSAPYLGADALAAARAANELLRELLDDFDPRTFTVLNHEFHRVLYGSCPNERLLELVDSEWARMGQLRHSTFAFVPDRAADSVREHDAILNLVESRAPTQTVEAAVRRHRLATLNAYDLREHPERTPGPL